MAMNKKQKQGLAVGLGALLGLFGLSSISWGKSGCGPFKIKKAQLEKLFANAINAGRRSTTTVAQFACMTLFPVHPKTKKKLTWPPPKGAHKDQICAWKSVLRLVTLWFKDQPYPPFPPCATGFEVNPVTGMCEKTTPKAGPTPPESGEDGGYPNPGTFVQIQYGDRGLGKFTPGKHSTDAQGTALRSLAYTTLLSGGYLAAIGPGGLPEGSEAAFEFAREVASKHRKRYWDKFIQCSPYNDMTYTTHGYKKGMSSPNPSGRALRMFPWHADNRSNIYAGRSSVRRLAAGKLGDENSKSTHHSAPGGNFAFLWLPDFNKQVLWDSGGNTLTSEGMEWEDGSSMMSPPPDVMALGFSGVPAGTWGCAEDVIEVE